MSVLEGILLLYLLKKSIYFHYKNTWQCVTILEGESRTPLSSTNTLRSLSNPVQLRKRCIPLVR